jgi:hypothetical protein
MQPGLLISALAVARIREDMTYGNGIAKRALQADLAALTGRGHKVGIACTPSKQSTPLVDEFWGTEHAQASRDHTHAGSAAPCERCAGSGVVWPLWLQAASCRDSPTCSGPCGSLSGLHMHTHQWSSRRRFMSSRHRRSLSNRHLHLRRTGTIATTHRVTTHMSSSAPAGGGRWSHRRRSRRS